MYYAVTRTDELQHHGIKGMKWGVRRYQNADGTLTEAGKRKLSKKYKRHIIAYEKDSMRNRRSLNIRAYNETADDYNNGKIAEFNRTHDSKSKNYASEYAKQFTNDYHKKYDKLMLSEIESNRHYKKAQEILEKYSMVEFDDRARKNSEFVRDLKEAMANGKTSWDLDMKKYLPDD